MSVRPEKIPNPIQDMPPKSGWLKVRLVCVLLYTERERERERENRICTVRRTAVRLLLIAKSQRTVAHLCLLSHPDFSFSSHP